MQVYRRFSHAVIDLIRVFQHLWESLANGPVHWLQFTVHKYIDRLAKDVIMLVCVYMQFKWLNLNNIT